MVPPQLVLKWARECFLTIPGVRVFVVDGVRNGLASNGYSGVNEVCMRNGHVRREGLKTTLTDLRLAKRHRSAKARWRKLCPGPAVFIVSRERAKLGYFWKHAYRIARSGPYNGCVINPDTGKPVLTSDDQLRLVDFRKAKHAEMITPDANGDRKGRKQFFSALWQADRERVQRVAPVEFMGRYMKRFFDYAVADEMHELATTLRRVRRSAQWLQWRVGHSPSPAPIAPGMPTTRSINVIRPTRGLPAQYRNLSTSTADVSCSKPWPIIAFSTWDSGASLPDSGRLPSS